MTWKLDCGSYTLFIIEDGYYWRDPKTYYAGSTEHDWRFHPRDEHGHARLNFGCYLLTDGEHTIMIDAGIGQMGKPDMVTGLMPEAVDALGIARDSVETVIYTHMHYDHIGGTQREGQIIFPTARHVFHTREWEHWRTVDDDLGAAARTIMGPLFDADLVDFIHGDTQILPGVSAVETPGHTPGHVSVSIMSDGTRTLVGGDISNHPFQVEHPHWSLPVDGDHDLSAATRDRVFEEIRDTGTAFLASHYPMPGLGEIVTDDGLRVFQPGSPAKV